MDLNNILGSIVSVLVLGFAGKFYLEYKRSKRIEREYERLKLKSEIEQYENEIDNTPLDELVRDSNDSRSNGDHSGD